MKEEEFRSWLATQRNLSERTIGSRISNCRTVERHEGDLDSQFEQDKLQGLTRRLTYSSRDQVANKPAQHSIPIQGNMYTGTATLRSAVSLYKKFRETEIDDTLIQPKTPNKHPPPSAVRSDATTIVQDNLVISAGTVLQNRYRIIRKLGEGGMGAVYEAVDQRLDCVVALKEATVAGDEGRRAFHREASLLANLRHRALPNVMDHFGEGDGQFLVMQFIPGEDLAAILKKMGRFSPAEVYRWGDVILRTLEYLHARNPPILHRDVKPANLKLTDDDELFLLDFGLAKGRLGQMQTMLTTRSIFGHTPVYSPLEQIIGAGTDPRSDLYSLGATLYHLITGTVPVDAPTRYNTVEEGGIDPLRPAFTVNANIPRNLSEFIQKAMAIGRRERWNTAAEMREALRTVGSNKPSVGKPHDASRTIASSSQKETPQRIVFLNNCQNRNHVGIYGSDAFYDLSTSGFQSTLALNFPAGQMCIVSSMGNNHEIVFGWYSFQREEVRRDDRGILCRVFFGKLIRSVQYSKAEAARKEPYTAFFDVNGNFKRHSVHTRVSNVTEPIGKRPPRSRTSEKEFFEELRRQSPAEAKVAKRILDWSRENFTQVNWKGSSFVPVLQYGARFSHNPITVYAVGKTPRVGIKFGRMKRRNHLSQDTRVELLSRLNEIPGVQLPDNSIDRYPTILLSTLTNENAIEQFLDAIAWTNEEIKTLQKEKS